MVCGRQVVFVPFLSMPTFLKKYFLQEYNVAKVVFRKILSHGTYVKNKYVSYLFDETKLLMTDFFNETKSLMTDQGDKRK